MNPYAPNMLHQTLSAAEVSSESTIRAAFSPLRRQWACNFALNFDPLVDANILTSPAQVQYAIAGENAAIVEDPNSPKNKLLETDSKIQWVFVPAFNADGQGAGYLITKSKSGRDKGASGGHLNALYRIIRNDDNGDLLTICEIPDQNVIQLVFMRHLSATVRKRDIFVVRRDSLRRLFLRSYHPSEPEISSCFMTFMSFMERRVCPVCSCVYCTCKLVMRRPSHPSDFEHSARNMATHCGTFFGRGVMSWYRDGACFLHRAFDTQNTTAGGSDAGLTYALNKWAVHQQLGGLIVYPPKLIQSSWALSRRQSEFDHVVATEAVTPLYDVGCLNGKSLEDVVDDVLESTANHNSDQLTQNVIPRMQVTQGKARESYRPLAPRGEVVAGSSSEEKGLQRKIQKRLAAQRNDKRRAENLKNLRSSLNAIRVKHNELERKKELLLEENARLRQAWEQTLLISEGADTLDQL